jgi:hypothetical protein
MLHGQVDVGTLSFSSNLDAISKGADGTCKQRRGAGVE